MPHVTLVPEGEENRALLSNVHPERWENPVPSGRYNLVVIGAGTAGLVTAAAGAALGARVALVERHLMGGDCLNTGCVPSKALLRSARALFDGTTAERFALSAGTPGCDFAEVMRRMRALRAQLSGHDSARRFRDELGVDVFFGDCRFVAPDAVEVGGRTLHFRKAALCTGSRAKVPDLPGLEEGGYLTNETVFSLETLPPRLAVVGAGPVGCELAQAFSRFGSRVTLIASGDQLLPREDPDAARLLNDAFAAEGIEILFNGRLRHVEVAAGEKVLAVERGGETIAVPCDAILLAVGRAPNVEGLDLERGEIAWDGSGVKVSDTLRTSNPRVYAAGDICSPYKFTHVADAQARIVVANALFGGRQKNSALVVPWCTYTDPEIAHVGGYERDLTGRVRTITVPLSAVDRAVLDGESDGFARVHLWGSSDRIAGATVVARHAGELVGELAVAMRNGVGLKGIGATIHPYPTQSEVLRKVADTFNRTRLTPFVKKVLSAWLSWQRR
ncbi:mercuric reductase [Geomonas sp. RF6]|uniref:mercuric reductase n=1 Tax=Geomonas sp. RF6 TaxID=2897342 RepID=UPI001E2FA982|nr:mercuric reductase [Geomonas sp. RF6]UFS71074.1 mercuric reductase [Geomonas sp. RF6]